MLGNPFELAFNQAQKLYKITALSPKWEAFFKIKFTAKNLLFLSKNTRIVVKIIVAFDENRVIGKDNTLIWHLPADLQRFKTLTTGNVILMGRKTYESIGRPLPNRTTIVISRQIDLHIEGVIVVHSVEEAILKAKSISREDIFIVGGAEIYQLCMPLADQILLTQLHDVFEGDAFFPEISPEMWEVTEKERGITDEKNPFQYSFITYQKK